MTQDGTDFDTVFEQALQDLRASDPPVAHVLQWFTYKHLPTHLQQISRNFAVLAVFVAVPPVGHRGPETTVALRKLLEAKDAAVRAAVGRP